MQTTVCLTNLLQQHLLYIRDKKVKNKHVLCCRGKLSRCRPGALSLRQGRLHNITPQDQNCNLFTGKSAHLAKHLRWQQDEKMTQRNYVGEWWESKRCESWVRPGRSPLPLQWKPDYTEPDEAERPALPPRAADQQRGASWMSVPVYFANRTGTKSMGAETERDRERWGF